MPPTTTDAGLHPDQRTEDEPFEDVVTEEGHQHDRVDHNVEGVYGGGGYHRATHGADAHEVVLPGMRAAQPEHRMVHVQNEDVAGPAGPGTDVEDAARIQNEGAEELTA